MGQIISKKSKNQSNQHTTTITKLSNNGSITSANESLPDIVVFKRMDSSALQDDMEGLINKDITLPENKPFIITWELVKKIRIENRFDLFHRSPKMQEKYMESVNKNKEIYYDYESKLLNQFFNVPLFKDPKTGKLKANNNALKKLGKKMKWTDNAFPYNFDKNIKHDLLWCTKALTLDEIKNEIKKNIPKDRKVIWWVNPRKYRSVPGLYHAQILSYKPDN